MVAVGNSNASTVYSHGYLLPYVRLLSMPYENESILSGQNICLRWYQSLLLMFYFARELDLSFHTDNVGQRPSKLLTVKVGIIKKKSTASAIPAKLCASPFSLGLS